MCVGAVSVLYNTCMLFQSGTERSIILRIYRDPSPARRHRCTMAEEIKSGYMHKCGKSVKSWKRRWFVLKQNGYLYYYTDASARVEKGKIDVVDAANVAPYTAKTKGADPPPATLSTSNAFVIITKDRVFTCVCETGEEFKSWIGTLEKIRGTSPSEQHYPPPTYAGNNSSTTGPPTSKPAPPPPYTPQAPPPYPQTFSMPVPQPQPSYTPQYTAPTPRPPYYGPPQPATPYPPGQYQHPPPRPPPAQYVPPVQNPTYPQPAYRPMPQPATYVPPQQYPPRPQQGGYPPQQYPPRPPQGGYPPQYPPQQYRPMPPRPQSVMRQQQTTTVTVVTVPPPQPRHFIVRRY